MTYEDELASEVKEDQPGQIESAGDREDFWADTCREITQMLHGSHEAVELYRKYGCRFCAPGRQQVQYVLNALDAAMPHWEKEHPELFFQTLELNYPESVRRT